MSTAPTGTVAYGTDRETAAREMPWNVMGKALSVKATTSVTKALAETGLDYDVRMVPVTAYDLTEGEPLAMADFIPAPANRAVVRPMPDGTNRVLAITGTRYTPIQNRDAYAVGTYLVDEFGATIDGLADFRSGAASILALNLGGIDLKRPDGEIDPLRLNLLIKNSHDGNGALTFALTPMRIACTNAVQAAIAKAERVWKVSHTPKADHRVALAKDSILKSVTFSEAFQVKAQAMIDATLADAEFDKIVASLWKVAPDAEGAHAERRREVQEQVKAIYRNSPTLEGLHGTRWGGYNAITEYLDHYRPVKGDQAVARAEGALEGPNVRVKANVWKMFAAA
jgi:phage/plasmid-like protein (TIGR03299 family)